jgi:peptidoglycan hydrolase-like protein with peptidoglycan-binding domain
VLGRVCAVMVVAIIAVGLTASSGYAAGLSRTQVNHAQKRLGALGFEVGPADGVVGPMTARGMCAFEEERKGKKQADHSGKHRARRQRLTRAGELCYKARQVANL